jgi:hypothetical protein
VESDDPAGMLLIKRMIIFSMVRATVSINNTSFASSTILLVQGQADVTAIRFFPASVLDLGEFPGKSDALLKFQIIGCKFRKPVVEKQKRRKHSS